MARLSERELVELMSRWKDEMVGLVRDYQISVRSIEKAVDNLEKQEKQWYVVYRPLIITAGALLVLVILVMLMQHTNVCQISYNPETVGFEIQRCTK